MKEGTGADWMEKQMQNMGFLGMPSGVHRNQIEKWKSLDKEKKEV